jgi:hypothetical protein
VVGEAKNGEVGGKWQRSLAVGAFAVPTPIDILSGIEGIVRLQQNTWR